MSSTKPAEPTKRYRMNLISKTLFINAFKVSKMKTYAVEIDNLLNIAKYINNENREIDKKLFLIN